MAANRPNGGISAANRYAWLIFAIGAALLIYLLLRPEPGGVPGWEPANASLRLTLPAEEKKPMAGTGAAAEEHRTVPASPPSSASPAAKPESPAQPEPARASTSASGRLDLNTATLSELDSLPGIGPSKAKAIVAYRDEHKGFGTVEELLNVKGIGPKLLERIRPHVAAGAASSGS